MLCMNRIRAVGASAKKILGLGRVFAAERLRGHGVAVERFSDPPSLMAALNRFGQ